MEEGKQSYLVKLNFYIQLGPVHHTGVVFLS